VQGRIFKYLNLLLHWHDKAIIGSLIKTNDQFKVSSLNSTTKTISEEGLIFLTFT
jgi:hypothetical protein